ncbi:MAG: DUF1343 domain-containing protein [Weeksellaceae bacterium]
MFQKLFKYTLIALFPVFISYGQNNLSFEEEILTGAEQPNRYLNLLIENRVGVVTNQTGITKGEIIGKISCKKDPITSDCALFSKISIVDFLIKNNINVQKIFSPEHGFRGDADAGATVESGKDSKTGLPVISLYGNNKKPTPEQLNDLDVILFDLQDVGVRFYTYISTLHYVMEAAAENNIPVILLDRPNPNGHYIDGPVLNPKFKSFVGMHPVPVVYGMTIGEYALMINGEKWLKNGIQCDLKVIPLSGYSHKSFYSLPVKPSPNLPNHTAINLYPSTCFFEAFNGSEGRGTDKPFQIYGSPYLKNMDFQFIPQPNSGAKNPRFQGQICYGEDLSDVPFLSEINLEWLLKAHQNYEGKAPFWIKNSGEFWIDKLAGTDELRKQIDAGWTAEQIKATWQKDLEDFKEIRIKYLLYK